MKRIVALLLGFLLLIEAFPATAGSFDSHKATAFMDIAFECGCTRTGTGAMIGRRGLITCGHNLYCHEHGKGLKYCNFLFGAKSPNSGQKRYNGKFTYWSKGTFEYAYEAIDDIGYVIFNNAIGDSTGWFGWMTGPDDDLNMEFTNVDYYTNKGRFENIYTFQYVESSYLLSLDECPPSGGDGAPVFMTDESGDEYYVVGVYLSGNNGKGYARRLTKDIIDSMRANGAFN